MYAEPTQSKICGRCQKDKPLAEFYNSAKKCGKAYRYLCKDCERQRHNEYVALNKERINQKRRENYHRDKSYVINLGLKRLYKIDLREYKKMLQEQDGRCAICQIQQDHCDRKFAVDHNHKTGKVRGLLCVKCNRGIGLLQDSPDILEIAIGYLKSGN